MQGDCAPDGPDSRDPKLIALENEVMDLRRENAKLLHLAAASLMARLQGMPKDELMKWIDAYNSMNGR